MSEETFAIMQSKTKNKNGNDRSRNARDFY